MAIQAETTVTTAQTAHIVRARHTAAITAMSITEIQANRRKSQLSDKPSKHKKGGVIALIIAVVVCVALGVTGIAVSLSNKDGAKKQTSEKTSADSSTVTINETPTASSTDKSGSLTAAGVYNQIKDSSVGILVYSDSRSSSAHRVRARA